MAEARGSVDDEGLWYVWAAGRAWGPYTAARLASFIGEGRVTSRSLISDTVTGRFVCAAERSELAPLFSDREPKSETMLIPSPRGNTAKKAAPAKLSRSSKATVAEAVEVNAPAETPDASIGNAPASHALVVWADLVSLAPQRFESALTEFGPFAGIRPGVWLLRSPHDAARVRNGLSLCLKGEDALLVLETPLDRAAWFNLDGAAEYNLRQLWRGSDAEKI